jgi:putative tryptophan/tyrosine transport system substrate-binding protein
LDTALENRKFILALAEGSRLKLFFSGLLPVFFLLQIQAAAAWAQPARSSPQEKKRVVVLFSYRPGWWAVKDENRGILDGLATLGYTEKSNLDITRLYMNTKTVNKTARQMETAASDLLTRIEAIDPDVLVIMDDDALRHVGAKLLDTALPIVFGGINLLVTDADYGWVTGRERSALADSLEYPGHNLTGVLERIAIASGFNLLHQILPHAKSALFLSDKSMLSRQMLRVAGDQEALRALPITIERLLFTDSFEEMQQTVLDYQSRVDCIVMFLPWTFEDHDGRHVPQEQVMRWLLDNNKRPGIAYLDILAEEGFLCGVVVDMHKQGVHAGIIAGRILDGEQPGGIPIIDPVANRIMINLARARQLNIDIPFEVLKSADVILNMMTAYPEFDEKWLPKLPSSPIPVLERGVRSSKY